ncbi:hypothetical protein [Kitasatospora sp. CB01950]|uniref:hypothetical protein n=1 Tax=Kitasatospora sp. CB01950 TaxID=1703930 RepID=UPI00130112FD|nr:hypothetical protein [Kitasatospora sp. CB01950]
MGSPRPNQPAAPAAPSRPAVPVARRERAARPAAPAAPAAPVAHAVPAPAAVPAQPASAEQLDPSTRAGREAVHQLVAEAVKERNRKAVSVLLRAIAGTPRLRIGQAEARRLAPQVVPWLERGVPESELTRALTDGLPDRILSPGGFLRYRLETKLPPVPEAAPPPRAPYAECARCCDPIPEPGICRPCAGLGARTPAVGGGQAFARTGAARVREAMQWVRAGKGVGNPVPAG